MDVAGKIGNLYSDAHSFHLLKALRYLAVVEPALERRTATGSVMARSWRACDHLAASRVTNDQ